MKADWDMFRWHKETPLEDITKGLQKFLQVKNNPYAKFKTIQAMAVTQRSPSGRILELAVKTDIGTFTLHKDEVRSAFAAPRSTLFYLKPLNKGKPRSLGICLCWWWIRTWSRLESNWCSKFSQTRLVEVRKFCNFTIPVLKLKFSATRLSFKYNISLSIFLTFALVPEAYRLLYERILPTRSVSQRRTQREGRNA